MYEYNSMEVDSHFDGAAPYSPSGTEIKRDRSRSPINGNDNNDVDRRRGNRQAGRFNKATSDKRVYVANIPFDCKWSQIKDLFREKVGEVDYVEFFDDEKGKFRGCGIVAFKDPSLVQKSIEIMHRFDYKGRQLVVKEDYDVERDSAGRPLPRGGSGGGGGGGGRNSMGSSGNAGGREMRNRDRHSEPINTYGLSPQFLNSLSISGPLGSKVFVANLDFKVSSQKLEEVFKMAGKVLSVELKKDEEGNSKGHGIVEMGHPVEAVQAISMFNGQKLFSRTMSVRMDKKAAHEKGDKLPSGLEGIGKGLGHGGIPLNLENPQGLPNANTNTIPALASLGLGASALNNATLGVDLVGERNLLASSLGLGAAGAGLLGAAASGLGLGSGLGSGLGAAGTGALANNLVAGMNRGIGGGQGLNSNVYGGGNSYDLNNYQENQRLSDTVIVRNLPPNYSWQALKERFKDIGDVRHAEMKGRGMALVRFRTEREAKRASDLMDGSRIDGYPIEVCIF